MVLVYNAYAVATTIGCLLTTIKWNSKPSLVAINMPRPKHPKKEIEAALKHAEAQGWQIKTRGIHQLMQDRFIG